MCGFVGFSGSYNASSLRESLDSIAHRGPDDSGLFFDKTARVGLGHQRLSIQDTSQLGHQPMISSAGTVLAYNGEVYNFKSLKLDLEDKGYVFEGASDTEVVLIYMKNMV